MNYYLTQKFSPKGNLMRHLFILLALSFINFHLFSQDNPRLVIDPQGHSAMIKDVMFTKDGKTLISVSDDKTIRVWNTTNGTIRKTIRGQIGAGPFGKLNAGAISPDGNLIAVAGYLPNDEIRIIHLATGQQIATLLGHENTVTDLDFSGDGKFLASSGGDNSVRIWSIPELTGKDQFSPNDEPQLLSSFSDHTAPVYGVAFAPNGKKVVSASFDGTLRLYYLTPEGTSAAPSKSMAGQMVDHSDRVYCVDFSPDGKYIASGGLDGKIQLWDSDGNFYNTIQELGQEIFTISFSHEMNKLVAMTKDGTVYEIPYGLTLGKFTKHDNTVRASAFAPVRTKEGVEIIATAGGSDNEIFLWNAEDGKVLQHLEGQGQAVWTVGFGNEKELAFGNTYAPKNVADRGPFEKSFDFKELKLNLQQIDPSKFKRSKTSGGGLSLRQTSEYSLNFGNGAKVTNTASSGRIIRSYAVTPNGQVVVGSAGALKLYNSSGKELREFVGHTGEVWSVSISDDGKILTSASNDQTIKVWNIDTGENLVTLFIAKDNDWVCWTPQGYYTASAGGEKYVGWHVNRGDDKSAEFFPVKTFSKKYFKPELVKLTIEHGSFEIAKTIYGQTNQEIIVVEEEEIKDLLPPSVEWLIPSKDFLEVKENRVKIKAKVTSDSPITKVEVYVDGRPVSKGRGFKVEQTNTPTKKWVDFDVPLVNAESRIQIYAANENAEGISGERIIRVKKEKRETDIVEEAEELEFDVFDYIVKPNLYLLSIGISDFTQSDYNLNYADDDAHAISQVFKNRKDKLYGNIIVKELVNEKATRHNILNEFRWLEENATQKDLVVIFIASHGFNEKNHFYILPHDGDPENLRETGVDWQNFAEVLANLPSKVLMLVDACHSGQLGTNVGYVNNTEALRTMSSVENGVIIMSASTGDEYSLENTDWGHGAFTLALLEGLEKGQADIFPVDKTVFIDELSTYVKPRVRSLTNNHQNPTIQIPSTISTLPVVTLE